ncbi:MAG: ABC transporter substrate binding protein [bacterium]
MSKKKCRVAILMIRSRPFHKAMLNYLLNCIDNGPQDMYDPCILPFSGTNYDDIKNRVRKGVLDGYDVFMPIGEICTLAVKEALDEFGGHPTIFIGVANPIGHQLVQSLEKPGSYMTGVTREPLAANKIVQAFSVLYPTITNVLIPYLPTAGAGLLTKQVIEIKKQLTALGMQVFAIPIDDNQESLFKVLDDYHSRVQSVLFMEGCSSNIFQAQVAYYCWENELLFCGSGTYAINQGSACAFSGEMRDGTTAAYKSLRAYNEKNIPISAIPIEVLPDNQEFYINIDILRKINFPQEKIEELKKNQFIKVIRKWIDSPENK